MAGLTAFLAVTWLGAARAEQRAASDWTVEPILTGQDVRCLASNPLDPHVIYAGTQGNGVFRSDDQGVSWRPVGMQGQVVKSLAISPHEPSVAYAGTRPAFVYRTRDGGGTWEELAGFRRIRSRWFWWSPAESPWKAYVQAMSVSPAAPGRILAGVEFGAVVLSEDGGETWSAHRRGSLRDCHDLKFHARDGDWAYEAGGTGGGASVSRDGGRTWRKMKEGLAKNYGVACAADPAQPEIWYVSVAPGPGKAYGEQAQAYLYRASGGAAWHPIGWAPHPMAHMPRALVTDPEAPGHLYAGVTNGDVWHSPDYGESWAKLPFNFGAQVVSLVMIRQSPTRR